MKNNFIMFLMLFVIFIIPVHSRENVQQLFSKENLENMSYWIDDFGEGDPTLVALKNGKSSDGYNVGLTDEIAYGKLNTKPVAVVVVAITPEGGNFVSNMLHVVINKNGKLTDIARHGLGVNSNANPIRIKNNRIIVTTLTYGPDDPHCCPTKKVKEIYRLKDNKLVKVNR